MDTFFADVWQVDLRTGVDIVHSARYHIEPSLTLTEDSVRVCGDADAAEALVCIALRYSYFDEHNEALLTPKREYWPEVSESVSATSGVELTIDNVLAWPLQQLAPVHPFLWEHRRSQRPGLLVGTSRRSVTFCRSVRTEAQRRCNTPNNICRWWRLLRSVMSQKAWSACITTKWRVRRIIRVHVMARAAGSDQEKVIDAVRVTLKRINGWVGIGYVILEIFERLDWLQFSERTCQALYVHITHIGPIGVNEVTSGAQFERDHFVRGCARSREEHPTTLAV